MPQPKMSDRHNLAMTVGSREAKYLSSAVISANVPFSVHISAKPTDGRYVRLLTDYMYILYQ